ncbi:hypothetical protein [Roseibium sp. Sym1]|uniref:hypothetical protein n=1 Tax=Roseibium sp. Sym1 TaxID=3016006 RepID=UPI0022B4FB32|nr:hypothetical protein [Roseibium sp. Sym1]
MGYARWSPSDWSDYSKKHVAGKSSAEIFTSSSMKDPFDPSKIEFRESRDSDVNPASTPIILASDVTGSMGMIAETMIRKGLNTVATEIYNRKPVTDPHIMAMAVGDAECDRSPLQVTQFEGDIKIAEQLKELYIERGGGANGGESYMLPHVFAAMKTRTDAFEKRRKKGYLFTIGDEPTLDGVTKEQAKRFLGLDLQANLSAEDCINLASRTYEVFHVILSTVGHARHRLDEVKRTFEPILPQRILYVEDPDKVAESIVSAIQICEGANKAEVVASWSGDTSLVVANATRDLATGGGRGIQRLG